MAQPSLPPRTVSQASSTSSISDGQGPLPGPTRKRTIHLTPYAQYNKHENQTNSPYYDSTGLDDPRSSSTQSLRPVESAGPTRRTLLLVYIHGFMGTETSFKSFPAHVHSLLTMTLAETHIVHTKIYPRYASRKHISFAADAFSNWLQPHESDHTDVVLLGHSLGGILAAEVVLLPSHTPGSQEALQHRILGQIAYDTPFLGMHPGVVSTGIASLFRGAPETPGATTETISDPTSPAASSTSGSQPNLFDPPPTDPNFNPAFPNDVKLPVRKNKFERAWYFWNKHSGDLRKAAQSYVKSHLEFGGCLADYQGLHKRYNAIRPLEDVDELAGKRDGNGKLIPRVRFVNYYTASTGRIKERQPSPQNQVLIAETEMKDMSGKDSQTVDRSESRSITPRISIEDHTSDSVITKDLEDLDLIEPEMSHVDPRPATPSSDGHSDPENPSLSTVTSELDTISSVQSLSASLPPLPDIPSEPAPFDPSLYPDPENLKLAQKDYERQKKAYERAVKDREKAVQQREKVIAKREKAAKKEHEKLEKQDILEKKKRDKENLKRKATLNQNAYDKELHREAGEEPNVDDKKGAKPAKKQRDRKFCTLPSKDPTTGQRDPTWIRVFMEGMDEVVAHTSLFIVGEAYAKLVGDTAQRIEDWLHEDATRRILMNEQPD